MKKRENFYSKLFMEEKMAIKNCLRMVLIILLLGITVVGFNSCSKNMDNRLSGTWVRTNDSGSEVKVSYKSGNYEFTVDGIPDEKGTFTTSDGKIFYNITHLYGTELELDSKWYSKNELQTALKDVEWAKEFLSEINSPFVHEYTINGNTYTSINARGREWTYTKISDSKKKSASDVESSSKFQGTWKGYYRDDYIELYIFSDSKWRILSNGRDDSGKYTSSGDKITLLTEGTSWSNNNFICTVAGNGMIIERSGRQGSLTRK